MIIILVIRYSQILHGGKIIMKGKKIFAITLVVIMLINVFLTSFSTVFAAETTPYTFNNKLYKAVKKH